MSKAAKINKAIDWIAYAAGAYFVGTAIAGAIKKHREKNSGTNGIGGYGKAIHEIYNNLQKDYMYTQVRRDNNGGWDTWDVMWMTYRGYIAWRNYGQSACKNNLRDLYWTIINIFDTTPEEFVKKYWLTYYKDNVKYGVNPHTGEVIVLADWRDK